MKTAIVLSGQTAALGVSRALAQMGVKVVLLHYHRQDFAQWSRFVSAAWRVPHPDEDEAGFVAALERCAEAHPGVVVIPAADECLVALARNKQQLAARLRLACCDWDVVQQLIDKQHTYRVAEACGVSLPRTLLPRTPAEAGAAAAQLGFPCLVKPCQSHLFFARFGRKMVQVGTRDEAEAVCAAASAAGLEVLLQELIPGDDCEVVNYNAYVVPGAAPVEFTAVHLRNAPPRFGSPRVVVSRRVPEVIEPGRRLLAALGFSGYACTEFKRDSRDGRYKLMEVNGRHNLSTLLAVRCGINFPWLHFRHLVEGVAPCPVAFREEVCWIDLIRDCGYSALCLFEERYPLAAYMEPYRREHHFAIFDRDDPLPFVRRIGSLLQRGSHASLQRAGGARLPLLRRVFGGEEGHRHHFIKGEGR